MADKNFKVKTGIDLPAPLSLAQGGTGQTSANNVLNAILPLQSGHSSKVLQTDGTNTLWTTLPSTITKTLNTVAGINSVELVRGNMADNDYFRILVGGTASNAGYAEIATASSGTEPIYVRQYTGEFTSLVRTLTLLDGAGNSSFPGSISAITKSFDIEHPTKDNMRLRYGSLEGPENGVYIRGKSNINIIDLPDYWTGLVDEKTITVNITSIGKPQKIYVEKIEDNKIYIGGKIKEYFYTIYAERKDVYSLVVEY